MGDVDGAASVPCSVIKHGRTELTDKTETTVNDDDKDSLKTDNISESAFNNDENLSGKCKDDFFNANHVVKEEDALIENEQDSTIDYNEEIRNNENEEENKQKKKKASKRKGDDCGSYKSSIKKRKGYHEIVEDFDGNGSEENEDETYVPQYDELSPEDLDDIEDESASEEESKPKKRGRVKKNPNLVPSHLSQDMSLGYKILHTFMETPQFSIFQRPDQLNLEAEPDEIVCLNQMKKKFDDNFYELLSEFVNDVRSMLTKIYESRNTIAVKKALRLEQLLEQRIAQLPNYLRPQCALVLEPQETENSTQKTMNKGGSFVSLLYCRAEKQRLEKDKEKRKVLAEERKQLKEEQDKDMLEWEKNVLLKDHEEEIKCMWELPQIGHFVHLCSNLLNIGEISQYEIERMLLMPQCSSTLDLLMTSLLSNSLERSRLHQSVSMPYSIWFPLVKHRVYSWYRALQKQNKQKVFEEIGVEPMFWDIVGSERNPLERYALHELPFLHRVWFLKTLCDVDFVRKKTVNENIRNQTLEEMGCVNLGVDRHGNRYIYFPHFEDVVRIFRQSPELDEGLKPAELVESIEGFESREGPVTIDKVFRDIYDVPEPVKIESPKKKPIPKGRQKKKKRGRRKGTPAPPKPAPAIETPARGLRQSPRLARKVYVDSDSEESDGSDLDLATLKGRLSDSKTLHKPISDKTFISYNVFRLPRDKVPQKAPNQRKSTYIKVADRIKQDDATQVLIKTEEKLGDIINSNMDEEDSKLDAEDSKDSRERDEKEDEKDEKDSFTVKNIENLKMVFRKSGDEVDAGETSEAQHYKTPSQFLPDRSKFYLVVDSVESLRQLISKFSSDDNDLEIVGSALRSGKKGKKPDESPSCEVQLIERLQLLLEEQEQWEADHLRTIKAHREKMYKEYTSFLERPTGFIHPNEKFWPTESEQPTTAVPTVVEPVNGGDTTTTNAVLEELCNDSGQGFSSQSNINLEAGLGLRPRTRTRTQRQFGLPLDRLPDELEMDDELEDEIESPESDDNWEMPQSHKKKPTSTSGGIGGVGGDSSRSSTPRTSRSNSNSKRSKNRTPKKSRPPVNTNVNVVNSDADKSKRALFWSPRSSDPSEELSWEANRQKLIEQKTVVRGDIDGEITELETLLKTTKKYGSPVSRPRVPPVPTIPGNKKPYFSQAQLKAMDAKNKQQASSDNNASSAPDIQLLLTVQTKKPAASVTIGNCAKRIANSKTTPEIIDLDTDNSSSANAKSPTKSSTAPTRPAIRPVSRPVPRVIGSTAGNKVISSVRATTPPRPSMPVRRPQPPPSRAPINFTNSEDIYLTDGTTYLKIDVKTAKEVMADSKIVEQRFGDKLEIAKGIQIITKSKIQQSPQQQQQPQVRPAASLRFIRPQNMPSQSLTIPTQQPQQQQVKAVTTLPRTQGFMLVQHQPAPNATSGGQQVIQVMQPGGAIGHLVPVSTAEGQQQLAFIRPANVGNIIRLPTSQVNMQVQPMQLASAATMQNDIVQQQPQQQLIQASNQNIIIHTSIPLTDENAHNAITLQGTETQNVISEDGSQIITPTSITNGRHTLLMQTTASPMQQSQQVQGSMTTTTGVRLVRPIQTNAVQTSGLRLIRPGHLVSQFQVQTATGMRIIRPGQVLQTRIVRPPVQVSPPNLQRPNIVQQIRPRPVTTTTVTTTVQAQTRPLATPLPNQTPLRGICPPVANPQSNLGRSGTSPSANSGDNVNKTAVQSAQTLVRDDGTFVMPTTLTFVPPQGQQLRPVAVVSQQNVRSTAVRSIVPTSVTQVQRGQMVANGPRLLTVVSTRGTAPATTVRGAAPTTLFLQEGGRLLPLSAATSTTSTASSNTTTFIQVDGSSVQGLVPRQPNATTVVRPQTPRKPVQVLYRPPVINVEDADDEEVVEVSADSNVDKFDILHGQLSAKQTPEGLKYTVKTSKGAEHVLTDDEVEARRAANNGHGRNKIKRLWIRNKSAGAFARRKSASSNQSHQSIATHPPVSKQTMCS